MKAKYFSFFTFLIIFSYSISSNAENLYILFDENCMDKLEFKQGSHRDYMSYRVNTGGGESLFLEIGLESKNGKATLPRPFIGCYNGSFDMNLVNRINARPDEVFMVVPRGRKYYISPIKHAAFYKNDGDLITYISPKYRFKFSLKNGIINENISFKNNRVNVYFEGKLDNDCSGTYLFKQVSKRNPSAYTSLKFVPEIGIIEETMNISSGNKPKDGLKISKINDKKYSRYLAALCKTKAGKESLTFNPKYKPEAFEVKPLKPSANPPDMRRKKPSEFSNKGTVPKKNAFHTVKKGETLYRIAKKYDISVAQIKSWNGSKSSVIHSGDKLRISAPTTATVADNNTSKLTEKSGMVWDKGKKTTSTSTWDKNTSGSHTVKRGETMAAIAMKYGYTEARFRQMNNMSKRQVAKTGQKLYTNDCQCPSPNQSKVKKGYPTGNYYNKSSEFTSKSPEPTRKLEPAPYNTRKKPTSYNSKPSAYDSKKAFKKPSEAFLDNYDAKYDPFTATDASKKGRNSSKNNVQHYDTPVNNNYNSKSTGYYSPPQQDITYPNMKVEETFDAGEFTSKGRPTKKNTPTSYNTKPKKKKVIYQVQEGDNLYRIARKYGVTVEHLRSINNLEVSEIIIPFQKIYIY